jgi:hypothetical protein
MKTDMNQLPHWEILAVMAAVVPGLPIGLYILLTRKQRATTREIRRAAAEHGWRYRVRHWQGNPAAFRIDGRSRSGRPVSVGCFRVSRI